MSGFQNVITNIRVIWVNPKRITEKRLSGLFFLFPHVNHHHLFIGILLIEDDERDGLYAIWLNLSHFGIVEIEQRVALLF